MNENAWPFAINLLVVPLKLFLILPDVTVPGIDFAHNKDFDEHKWCCLYTGQKLDDIYPTHSTYPSADNQISFISID